MTSAAKSDHGTIEQELIRLLHASVEDAGQIDRETDLVADLGLESVQVIEFLCEVEDRFDVIIDEVSLADVHTVADLAGVVERTIAG